MVHWSGCCHMCWGLSSHCFHKCVFIYLFIFVFFQRERERERDLILFIYTRVFCSRLMSHKTTEKTLQLGRTCLSLPARSRWRCLGTVGIPSLKLTANAPENWWQRETTWVFLGRPVFRVELLVSGGHDFDQWKWIGRWSCSEKQKKSVRCIAKRNCLLDQIQVMIAMFNKKIQYPRKITWKQTCLKIPWVVFFEIHPQELLTSATPRAAIATGNPPGLHRNGMSRAPDHGTQKSSVLSPVRVVELRFCLKNII